MQMKQILAYTLKDITTFGYRDLAQTSISFAKITNKVQKKRRLKYGNTEQILQDVLIGKESKIKQFIFTDIAKASIPILHEFDARHLSNLIYAYGLVEEVVLVENGSTFFGMLAKQVISFNRLDDFWPQALSNILWAYANVGVSNSQLSKKVADHIIQRDNLHKFIPQHLSNILWAFATAEESHPKLFKRLGDHIVGLDNLNNFWPQALSNIMWAYATLDEQHPELFNRLADHIVQLENLLNFKPQNHSNIIWAFATAKEQHPMLFKKVADHIVCCLDNLNNFKPQELKDIVWAYATTGEQHPQLFKKVAEHIAGLDNLKSFKPQELSNTLWSFATAEEQHPQLYKLLGDHIVQLPNLNEFKPQALSNIVWAFATAGESHSQLFKKVADHIVRLDSLRQFNEQELINVAWSYSVANIDAPPVSNDFINACLRKEHDFIVDELFQLHQWQLWQDEIKSDISLPASLKKRCYEAFISRIPRQSKLQDDVVSFLSAMGLQPQEEVLLKSGYRIDAVVEVDGKQIAVEVDGPSHFIGRDPKGRTILKHRQVAALDGMKVVSIPYWEWNELKNNSEKKKQYLQSLLGFETN